MVMALLCILIYCQYPGCDIIILQDFIIGGNLVTCREDDALLFPTFSNVSMIISK